MEGKKEKEEQWRDAIRGFGGGRRIWKRNV
jgi:hypothetical protein